MPRYSLETIVLILVILWLLGWLVIPLAGNLIHLLLVIILVIVVVRLLQGRRPLGQLTQSWRTLREFPLGKTEATGQSQQSSLSKHEAVDRSENDCGILLCPPSTTNGTSYSPP